MPGKPAGKFTRVAPTEKPAAPRTSGSSRAARRCVTAMLLLLMLLGGVLIVVAAGTYYQAVVEDSLAAARAAETPPPHLSPPPPPPGAQIRQAKLTHENFLREYGDAVKGVPLVIYEGRVNRQSKRPFKLAPGN